MSHYEAQSSSPQLLFERCLWGQAGPVRWAVISAINTVCFLVCLFWQSFASHLSFREEKNRTNHNNHTLPQTVFQVWLHTCWLLQDIQWTFIGNKLGHECKPDGIRRFICKAPASKLFPDRTILAMFFQSSRIRKVTTDSPDGKHMSALRRDEEPHAWTRHCQGASAKTIIPRNVWMSYVTLARL